MKKQDKIYFNFIFSMDLLHQEQFKGGGRSGGGRSSKQSMNNGGIVGSGIFGMIGTNVHCQATDTSYYCSFMKFIQVLLWVGILSYIVYFFYSFFTAGKSKRR